MKAREVMIRVNTKKIRPKTARTTFCSMNMTARAYTIVNAKKIQERIARALVDAAPKALRDNANNCRNMLSLTTS